MLPMLPNTSKIVNISITNSRRNSFLLLLQLFIKHIHRVSYIFDGFLERYTYIERWFFGDRKLINYQIFEEYD